MTEITIRDCESFINAAKRVIDDYPKMSCGICEAVCLNGATTLAFRIMKTLMDGYSEMYLRGISRYGDFSDHRLYFLLFITQLTPRKLYEMVTYNDY